MVPTNRLGNIRKVRSDVVVAKRRAETLETYTVPQLIALTIVEEFDVKVRPTKGEGVCGGVTHHFYSTHASVCDASPEAVRIYPYMLYGSTQCVRCWRRKVP